MPPRWPSWPTRHLAGPIGIRAANGARPAVRAAARLRGRAPAPPRFGRGPGSGPGGGPPWRPRGPYSRQGVAGHLGPIAIATRIGVRPHGRPAARPGPAPHRPRSPKMHWPVTSRSGPSASSSSSGKPTEGPPDAADAPQPAPEDRPHTGQAQPPHETEPPMQPTPRLRGRTRDAV